MPPPTKPPQHAVLWAIHGGQDGKGDDLYLRQSLIGLGWSRLGDLSLLPPTREAFTACVSRHEPGLTPRAAAARAGQLFRFVHEVSLGDFITYHCAKDQEVHVGTFVGDYRYDPVTAPEYVNLRRVQWLATFPRDRLSRTARRESDCSLSFFQIKTHAQEFLQALTTPDAS